MLPPAMTLALYWLSIANWLSIKSFSMDGEFTAHTEARTMKLILRLLLGVLAGTLIGVYGSVEIVRLLVTVKGLFGQLLAFTVPLIILFFVTSGIGSMHKGSGRLLGVTVTISYLSTIGAGFLAYGASALVIPEVLPAIATISTEVSEITPWFQITVSPVMDVMTALVLAFVFGLGISSTGASSLLKATEQGKIIIEMLLANIIIPLLPFYIACVFADMGASGTVFHTMKAFIWVLGLAIVLHWTWLLILFSTTGALVAKNPLTMLHTMLPSYMAALGTLSSAAAIPVTIECTNRLGVNRHVTDFTVPLCANIHLSGSVTTLTVCTIAVYMLGGGGIPQPAQFIPFLLTLGIAMVAAPGIPGGGVMTALGLLTSMMGFDDSGLALMIALYLAQDSFGTACNVAGDGAISTLTNAISEGRWRKN